MGKYAEAATGILSIFSASELASLNLYPSNFENISGDEYLRISIIPSSKGVNKYSISGLVNIDIFSTLGKGPKRFHIISDILDAYLVGKSKIAGGGVVQFFNSALDLKGQDKDNPTLYRALYSIPFYFNVSEV
jgi:hypothetical protein